MVALRIYLADLTHIGNGIATEAFPLNIGLVASYARKLYGNAVDISLFKYPDDLKQAITEFPPHILGCSNYTWNSNLSYYFCSLAKSLDRQIVTVYGGTNYPFDAEGQRNFLEARRDLDVHIYYEGEQAFSNIIERILSVSDRSKKFHDSIDGCQFIDRRTNEFVSGSPVPRIRDLNAIPSPYVTGILDKFFDGYLTPLLETARGCPFRCNFCNAGDVYFNKMNLFSDEYVQEELSYVAERAGKVGAGHVTFADNNFGMIPRDARTAEVLLGLQEKYGWPKSITAWTGKNSKERVIEVTRLLGESLSVSMSTQSMDESVLNKIGRKNIKLEDYRKIADDLNEQGRPQHAEVIMPLPGETLKSHVNGLNELLDTNVSRVLSHTLQMLHGTPYKDDEEYRREHGYVTKYRVVPLDFSHLDGKYIFDVEEVGVATNIFSLSEYVDARKYLFVIDVCYNSGVFGPLKKYLSGRDIKNSEWIGLIYQMLDKVQGRPRQVLDSFEEETMSELWDSEMELVRFYSSPENFERLVNYEVGGNVLFKHRVWMLTEVGKEWIDAVFQCTEDFVVARSRAEELSVVRREFETLKTFVQCTTYNCFGPDGLDQPISETFECDIPAWIKTPVKVCLEDFMTDKPITLKFYLTDRGISVLKDATSRYGTDIAGRVKMIQRIAGISFTRNFVYADKLNAHEPELLESRAYGPGVSSI